MNALLAAVDFFLFSLLESGKVYLPDICSGKSEGFSVEINCSCYFASEEHSGRPDKRNVTAGHFVG